MEGTTKEKLDHEAFTYENSNGTVEAGNVSRWARFVDGFKPAQIDEEQYAGLTQEERANLATANSPLARKLKNRHVQMIAIGGSIGTGLFVGLGDSLATAGPGSVLISYAIVGSALFATVQALGEMGTAFPVSGSFTNYAGRFFDYSMSFALGTNYALQWLAALPLELLSASICSQFWNQDLNPASIVIIFWLFIAAVTVLGGSRVYGEVEFIMSIVKVVAVIGFIIMGVVLTCGGGPDHEYIGGRYWNDPGAFNSGFKGFATSFVSSSFAFSGTELVGLAAAEMSNPRKDLPRATKQVFFRILLFYVVSVIVIGCMVPFTDKQLMGSGAAVDVNASPFVIAIKNAHVKVMPSIFNAVVLLAVLSVANSSVYGSSRTIAALSAQGQLPKFCGYIDREGRPMVGIVITLAFGLLCFVVAAGQDVQNEVFDWLMAISGLSALFTWASCCFCHVMLRWAMKVQNRSTDELPFRALGGIWGSIYGFCVLVFVLALQFWIAVWPLGDKSSARAFFKVYLSFPLAAVCYFGYKLIYRTKILKPSEIDLDTGRRILDPEEMRQEDEALKAEIRSRPMWYRVWRFWC